MDHYVAQTLPNHKADIVEQLRAEGKVVCYVGDGINDAIALRKAQVSISLPSGSAIASDTAQIILLNENLAQLEQLFQVGQQYNRMVKTNIGGIMASSAFCLGGAFFLGFGPVAASLIAQAVWLPSQLTRRGRC